MSMQRDSWLTAGHDCASARGQNDCFRCTFGRGELTQQAYIRERTWLAEAWHPSVRTSLAELLKDGEGAADDAIEHMRNTGGVLC